MYNIELQRLTLEDAQTRALGAVEDLCDKFHLENQFGVISSAANLLISLLERCTNDQDEEFTLNFYVESENFSIQLISYQNLNEVYQLIKNSTLEDSDSAAYSFSLLTDNVELRNENELWTDIAVSPQFDTADRAAILKQEEVRTKQLND